MAPTAMTNPILDSCFSANFQMGQIPWNDSRMRIPSLQVASEGLNAGNVPSQNQIVNVVGAFVGLDRFQIVHVSHDWVFAGHSVCAVNVSSHTCDIERNVDVGQLGQADEIGNPIVLVDFSTEVVCQQLALGNLSLHGGQLHLNQVESRNGAIELNPFH